MNASSDLLRAGQNVIHDATNLTQTARAWRHEAERQTGCWSLLLNIVLDETTTMARLTRRTARGDSISDADTSIYYLLRDAAEPIVQPHLLLRTDDNLDRDIQVLVERLQLMRSPTPPVERQKAFAYVLRNDELLVFTHPHAPEAGIQVIAGSVEPGEAPVETVLREAQEESGIAQVELVEKLGEWSRDMRDFGRNELHHRHYFHLRANQSTPVRWRHLERHGDDGGQHLFELFWAPLNNLPYLIADHGRFISLLPQ